MENNIAKETSSPEIKDTGTKALDLKNLDVKKTVLAVLGIVVGVAIAMIQPPEGLTVESMRVLGVIVWAIIFWIGGVLPEAITAIVMSVLFVVLSGVPVATSFSAFAGSTIWLVIAAIGLGVSIKACGLLERISILMLKAFPKNFIGRSIGLFVSTFVVSPFVPSTMAKTGIIAPLVRGISESAGYEGNSKQAHGLFFSYWTALKFAPCMIFTASVVTAALVGMLPEAQQAEYTLLNWAISSLPFILPFLAITLVVTIFMYRGKKGAAASGREVNDSYLDERLATLGGWSLKEKIMVVVVIACVVLWVTKSIHGIPEWAVTCFALAFCFVFKIINISQFRTQTSWEIIIFVGCAISIGSVLPAVGVIDWMTATFGPMTQGFFGNPFLLMVGLAVFSLGARFLLVSESGFLAVATALLIPLGLTAGVNPWVIALILSFYTMTWLLPYQSSLLLGTVAVMGDGFVKYGECTKFCIVCMVIGLVCSLIAVPIWSAMGIMYV